MTKEHGPDILMFPPLAFLGAVLLAIVLEWIAPLGLLPDFGSLGYAIPGYLILFGAVALAISGNRAFKRAGTNVNPRQPALVLVEGGPFRFTRNPMYLGMVLFQPGLALAFSLDWSLFLTPLLWAALHWGVVLREEAYLSGLFGDPYRTYLLSTRRWV